jgi:endogenous inhibitor of DNA gyrase (YacG/DUF329 family)
MMNSTSPQQFSREQAQMRTQRKTNLICPTCGHESPAGTDGDWALTKTGDDDVQRVTYECPVCWTSVVVQPQFEG